MVATAVLAGVQTAASLYDMFIDDSKDKAMAKFMEQSTKLAEEEKLQATKYADISAEMRDSSSFWMQDIKKNMLDVASAKADESIRSLRSQGIYSPSMERLLKKDFTVEAGETFMSNVGELTKTAATFSGYEKDAFKNYTDTMASMYQTQFQSTMTEPGYGEQVAGLISGFQTAGEAGEGIESLFSGLPGSNINTSTSYTGMV